MPPATGSQARCLANPEPQAGRSFPAPAPPGKSQKTRTLALLLAPGVTGDSPSALLPGVAPPCVWWRQKLRSGPRLDAEGRGEPGGLRAPRRLPPQESRSPRSPQPANLAAGSGTHLAARGIAAGCSRRRARTPSRSHSGGAPGGSRCGGGGGCAPSTRSPRLPPPARPSHAWWWRRGPRGGRNRHRHLTERPRPGGAGPRGGQGARPAPAPAPASGGPASPPGPAAATRRTGPGRPQRRDRGC